MKGKYAYKFGSTIRWNHWNTYWFAIAVIFSSGSESNAATSIADVGGCSTCLQVKENKQLKYKFRAVAPKHTYIMGLGKMVGTVPNLNATRSSLHFIWRCSKCRSQIKYFGWPTPSNSWWHMILSIHLTRYSPAIGSRKKCTRLSVVPW